MPAELEDASLEAVARAQGWVEEHHEQGTHREDVLVGTAHLVVGLEPEADLQHGLDLLPVEVAQGDEIASFEVPRDHFRFSFPCAVGPPNPTGCDRTSGGSQRSRSRRATTRQALHMLTCSQVV